MAHSSECSLTQASPPGSTPLVFNSDGRRSNLFDACTIAPTPPPMHSFDGSKNSDSKTATFIHFTKPRSCMRWLYWWGWEVGGCIGSFAAFLAVVGLLRSFDGKPQPEWPYGITLNSAVAWLTTIGKSCLLVPAAACISQCLWINYSRNAHDLVTIASYDAASRGPWGSLELLWALKAKRLACIGSLLTVLAIGIDPTVQQTVVVRTRMIDSELRSTVPRAQTFLQYSIVYGDFGMYVPTPAMTGAMYSGLFSEHEDSPNSRSSLDVIPSCPAGNCTFPSFQSLAVCAKCDNITALVRKECTLYANVTDLVSGVSPESASIDLCNYSLPNGLALNQTFSSAWQEQSNRQTTVCSAVLDIVKPVDYYGNFSSITLLKGDTRPGTSLPIQASQCTLSWCVNEYEASVENGRFSERIAESWQPRSQQWDTPWDFSPKQLTPPARGGTTATPNFTISADSEMSLKIWLVEKLSFSDSFSVRAVEDGEMKWISEGDLAWLPDLSSNFSAHWGDYGATSMPPNYDVLRLFRTEDPLEIMSRLAKAITTYIRSRNESEQTDSPPGGLPTIPTDTSLVGPVVGMSQTLEVYIAVRWPWLALSGTLLMLTLLFFALVVAQSAKGGVAVWKSSPLALLFHGLDEQSVERLRDTKEVAEMERRARHVRVQLCDQGSGVILKEVDH